jgi:hypothetical protein
MHNPSLSGGAGAETHEAEWRVHPQVRRKSGEAATISQYSRDVPK